MIVPGATMVMTLDDQMRIATVRGVPKGQSVDQLAPGELMFSMSVKDARGTILTARNNTGKPIIYAAGLINGEIKLDKMRSTSICPVMPGLTGFEAWPGKIDAIAILKIMEPPTEGMACLEATELLKIARKAKGE